MLSVVLILNIGSRLGLQGKLTSNVPLIGDDGATATRPSVEIV